MGNPFAMFQDPTQSEESDSRIEQLTKPNLTLSKLAEILNVTPARTNTILKRLTASQGLTTKSDGISKIYSLSQTGALRIIELADKTPAKTEKEVPKYTIEEEHNNTLGIKELIALSGGKLSQPIWVKMIKKHATLITRKNDSEPYTIKKEDLALFLKCLAEVDQSKVRIL